MYKKRTIIHKISLLLVTVLAFLSLGASTVSAVDPDPNACVGTRHECMCPANLNDPDCGKDPVFEQCKQNKQTSAYTDCKANNDLFKRYVNPLIRFLSALVALAVVIGIIIGGLQYTSSAGDPQKAAAGKNHIRNAILALLAWIFLLAILNFIIPGGLAT